MSQPRTEDSPTRHPGRRPGALVYIGLVVTVATGIVVTSLVVGAGGVPDFWLAVLVLGPLLVVTGAEASSVGVAQTKVTASGPVLLASFMIAGPWAAAAVGACTVFHLRPTSLTKRLFNAAQTSLCGFVAGAAYLTTGGVTATEGFHGGDFPRLLLPFLLADVLAVTVNGLLLAGVLRLAEGISPLAVWRTVVVSSVVPYLAYGLYGLLMAVLWQIGGPLGAVLTLPPLLVARWAFAQYAEQQRAYDATIRSLVQAVETKDHYTRGHSERVSRAAVMIAHVLALREDRVESLRYAGILHDVGKLGVPTKLLQKTGPLSDREFAAIQLHPVRGTEMVRGITFLEEAYEGIMHHHERLDGLGYPSGLKGAAIPEFARIIAVADAFDSMTSTRSYRGARTVLDALDEINRCKGTQFDPVMVQALRAALDKEPWTASPVQLVAPGVVPGAHVFVDHDDPTVGLPLGHDSAVAAEAEAERAEFESIRSEQ